LPPLYNGSCEHGDCEIQFIETEKQLADISTKPLLKKRFFFLRNELGILDSQILSQFYFYIFSYSICEDK